MNDMNEGGFNITPEVGRIIVARDMDAIYPKYYVVYVDEGDYSIKTIAKVLSESFRSSDVVGRMGGDEFAAFAIINKDSCSAKIKDRIQQSMQEFNDQSDKPYYVNISIGVHEFIIDDTVEIEQILTKADSELYIEKKAKKKRLCIYRSVDE